MATVFSQPSPNLKLLTTGLANIVTKVTVNADYVTFMPRTNASKLSYGEEASGLADGGALGSNGYKELPAGTGTKICCLGENGARRETTFYVTSATASTVVEIDTEGAL